MQTARFVAVARALDDEVSARHKVAQLEKVACDAKIFVKIVDFTLEQFDAVGGAFEAFVRAHDADIVPHEATQLVPIVRNDDFFIGIGDA